LPAEVDDARRGLQPEVPLHRHAGSAEAGTEGWTEDQLTEIVTRDCLIGVALAQALA
jgi:hypothetical protein